MCEYIKGFLNVAKFAAQQVSRQIESRVMASSPVALVSAFLFPGGEIAWLRVALVAFVLYRLFVWVHRLGMPIPLLSPPSSLTDFEILCLNVILSVLFFIFIYKTMENLTTIVGAKLFFMNYAKELPRSWPCPRSCRHDDLASRIRLLFTFYSMHDSLDF